MIGRTIGSIGKHAPHWVGLEQTAWDDSNGYFAKLEAEGREPLAATDQDKISEFASRLYALAGQRIDFITFRSSQNMAAGTVARTFHGKPVTLLNGLVWSEDGVVGSYAGGTIISLPEQNVTGTEPRTYMVVGKPSTPVNALDYGLVAYGTDSTGQLSLFYIENNSGSAWYLHNTWGASTGGVIYADYGTFQNYGFTYNGSNRQDFWRNGISVANSTTALNTGTGRYQLGSGPNGSFDGPVAFAIATDVDLSGVMHQINDAYFQTMGSGLDLPSAPGVNYVFEGDSITAGAGAADGLDWPSQAMALSAFMGGTKVNIATYGNTLNGIGGEYPSEVYPLRSTQRNYLFVSIGANDFGSLDVPAYMASLETYWQQAKNMNFIVVAATVLPRADRGSAPEEANRAALNAAIRASTVWDKLVDWAAIPELSDTSNLTYFNSDGIHPTAAGYALIAAAANVAIS